MIKIEIKGGEKKKMDSKAIRTALVAVMVFSVFVAATLPASASATADNFGVEDASGFKNANVLVPVNITNVHSESIVGIEFEFLYNSNVINLVEIQKGTLTSQWSEPVKKGTEGDYVIGIVGSLSTAIINGSTGSVVVLNFSATGEPGETSPMTLTNIKLTNTSWKETGTASPKNGTFTIIGGPTPTPTPSPTPTEPPSSEGGGGGGGGGAIAPSDTDRDGLSDFDEKVKYKTDPEKADTDGGGVNDGTEVARGTDPLDPKDDVVSTPTPKHPVTVIVPPLITPTPTSSPTPIPTPTPGAPGFEAVFGIVALSLVIYLLLKRK
jgi:hypothetical protein